MRTTMILAAAMAGALWANGALAQEGEPVETPTTDTVAEESVADAVIATTETPDAVDGNATASLTEGEAAMDAPDGVEGAALDEAALDDAALSEGERPTPQGFLLDEDNQPILDETGAPIPAAEGEIGYLLDDEGAPILDDMGDPIPADVGTGEEAGAEDSVLDGIMFFVNAGGPVIVILAVLSVLTLAIMIVKLLQFALAGLGGRSAVRRAVALLREGDETGALSLIADKRGPVMRVMEAAIRGRMAPGASDALVREEVQRVAQARIEGLERGLAFLGLIATVAPLIGLLGTVSGMIEAFQNLQRAGDRVDPAILSGGIWEALLTTAAGLAIAIPAAAIFTWLQRTVDGTALRMEDAATQVFTIDLYGSDAA